MPLPLSLLLLKPPWQFPIRGIGLPLLLYLLFVARKVNVNGEGEREHVAKSLEYSCGGSVVGGGGCSGGMGICGVISMVWQCPCCRITMGRWIGSRRQSHGCLFFALCLLASSACFSLKLFALCLFFDFPLGVIREERNNVGIR